MRHFGAILFGNLTAVSTLAVSWLSYGGGTGAAHAPIFGLAVSPMLYLVFVGPFALLFVVFLVRSMRN